MGKSACFFTKIPHMKLRILWQLPSFLVLALPDHSKGKALESFKPSGSTTSLYYLSRSLINRHVTVVQMSG